jgi:hypothetical protein
MFLIPGKLIGCVTFPGIVVHQAGRKLLCHATGTEVVEVVWFQWAHPMGYLVHEDPDAVWKQYLIGLGPLFVNTGCAVVLSLMAMPFVPKGPAPIGLPCLMLLWMAISVGMHAFPNTTDARSLWALAWESEDAPLWTRVLSVPFVGAVYLGAFLRFFWLDLIYGLLVVGGTMEAVSWLIR